MIQIELQMCLDSNGFKKYLIYIQIKLNKTFIDY